MAGEREKSRGVAGGRVEVLLAGERGGSLPRRLCRLPIRKTEEAVRLAFGAEQRGLGDAECLVQVRDPELVVSAVCEEDGSQQSVKKCENGTSLSMFYILHASLLGGFQVEKLIPWEALSWEWGRGMATDEPVKFLQNSYIL